MKKPPDNHEFRKFTQAMRHIMGVSKVELQRRIEADKAEKKAKRANVNSESGRRKSKV